MTLISKSGSRNLPSLTVRLLTRFAHEWNRKHQQ
jgi:hypothetical protein